VKDTFLSKKWYGRLCWQGASGSQCLTTALPVSLSFFFSSPWVNEEQDGRVGSLPISVIYKYKISVILEFTQPFMSTYHVPSTAFNTEHAVMSRSGQNSLL
jgi:hypothetical protein